MSLIAIQNRMIRAADAVGFPIPIWLLLLDTSSSVLDLVRPIKLLSSHRLRRNCSPLPSWLYLGFDQMNATNASQQATDSANTPFQALQIAALKGNGRPVGGVLSMPVSVRFRYALTDAMTFSFLCCICGGFFFSTGGLLRRKRRCAPLSSNSFLTKCR